MPYIEDAEWDDTRFRKQSVSVKALYGMKAGEVKRIFHNDIKCYPTTCYLAQSIHRLNKKGWEIEYYHESQYVAVVRRIK